MYWVPGVLHSNDSIMKWRGNHSAGVGPRLSMKAAYQRYKPTLTGTSKHENGLTDFTSTPRACIAATHSDSNSLKTCNLAYAPWINCSWIAACAAMRSNSSRRRDIWRRSISFCDEMKVKSCIASTSRICRNQMPVRDLVFKRRINH